MFLQLLDILQSFNHSYSRAVPISPFGDHADTV